MNESDESNGAAAALAAQPTSASAAKRNWFARHWIISLLALLIGSCAFLTRDRTVSWEEEVPLNTGETIWVKRYVTYKFDVTQDNPFVPSYFPKGVETREFAWKGKKYSYTGDAAIIVIAISPSTNLPTLVAMKSIYGQNQLCAKPFYDQLVVNEQKWEWERLPKIEPWILNLPRNLMAYRSKKFDEAEKRYSYTDQKSKDKNMMRDNPPSAYIDPNYQPEFCAKTSK